LSERHASYNKSTFGKNYDIWAGVKRKEAENVEARGKPLVVECDLAREPSNIRVEGGVYITMCSWDVEPDEQSPFDELPGPVEDDE